MSLMPHRRPSSVLFLTLLAAVLMISSSCGSPEGSAGGAPPSDEARAFLEDAQKRQLPAVQPGQVIHVVTREYERHAPPVADGPPHLDRESLFPETTALETWAIVGERGRIARTVTYTRDSGGGMIQQTVVDETGRLTSYNARHGVSTATTFSEMALISGVSGQLGSIQHALDRQPPQARRDEAQDGRPVVVLDHRSPPDPAWLSRVTEGESQTPHIKDLKIQSLGRRLVFERDSSKLLRNIEFAVTDRGEERVLTSKEWQRVEVLDRAQVPNGVLSPQMPTTTEQLTPVSVRQLPIREAVEALPYTVYVLDQPGDNITVPVGHPTDLATLPLRFRGLDFAVQRGEAARIVYDASTRYLDLVQGPSASFAASLRQAPAFWKDAKPITSTVTGTPVPGWYLTSPPNTVTDNPASGAVRQVPGPAWLLLPDVRGTGVLMKSQGYSETELLALVAGLKPAR